MRTSEVGISLIKSFESLHDGDLSLIGLQPKMCPAGIWTEGWGRTIRDSSGKFLRLKSDKEMAYKMSTIKTEAQADAALMEDLSVFERIVMSKVRVPLTQNQFDALVSYTYNTGGSDTLFKLINRKAPAEQIRRWMETKYTTVKKVVMKGLVRRRKAEADLFFK
jgi:lysozyme